MSGFDVTRTPAKLAPHPWDALGEPPRPGLPYDDVLTYLPIVEALRFAEQLRYIEDKRADARRLEYEADDMERDAEALEHALEVAPGLADAIGEDPWRFTTGADVLEWCETEGRGA